MLHSLPPPPVVDAVLSVVARRLLRAGVLLAALAALLLVPGASEVAAQDPGTLVSNLGQSGTTTTTIDGTEDDEYYIGFRLGTHGQGYAIDSVTIDLDTAPSSLTVSVYIAGIPGAIYAADRRFKLFDFRNPGTLQAGLNTFRAPAGSWIYQNVNHYIVLSNYGSELKIKETSSDAEDGGGEIGAVIFNDASSDGSDTLRMSLQGSQRTRGILASAFAHPKPQEAQDIISAGDDCCFTLTLGSADRYIVRSLSLYADDSINNGAFAIPINVKRGSTNEFDLSIDRFQHQNPGMNYWTAPQGATLEGSRDYKLQISIAPQSFDPNSSTYGGVILTRAFGNATDALDQPTGGATFTDQGDVALDTPMMAIEGEALYEVVSNFGQTDAGYLSLGGSAKVVIQGFKTGPDVNGYRFQGIGVNVEGSDSNGTPQVPAGPGRVSVAVHYALSDGKPGAKVFDLIDPDEFRPGHTFFEAPAGAELAPNVSYVMVWRHLGSTYHRLRRTSSHNEDSGAHGGFSIANDYITGGNANDLSSMLSVGAHAIEIAVYAVAFPPPPKADVAGERTLVSNEPSMVGSGNDLSLAFPARAQAFVTGPNSTGYTLTSISVAAGYGTVRSGIKLTATLHEAQARGSDRDDWEPAAEICELTGPRYHTVGAFSEFIVPTGCNQLQPNTRYFLVLERRASSTDMLWAWDDDTDEDEGAAVGWSIDNETVSLRSNNWLETENTALSLKVQGAINPAPLPDESDSILYLPMVERPFGMWSDGRTLWVLDEADDAIYAFDLFTGERRPHDDFLDLASGNSQPQGLWSDGTTMYVSDSRDIGSETYKIYAYKMSDKSRDSGKDINLGDLYTPRGIWGNGTTLWVTQDVHSGRSEEHELLAYKLGGSSHGDRDSGKDIDTLHDVSNWALGGVWSDGVTIWVVDHGDDRAYAYRLSDGKRVVDREIVFPDEQDAPRGIWSPDGQRFYIGDTGDDAIYVYGAKLRQDYWKAEFTIGEASSGSLGWSSTGSSYSGDNLDSGNVEMSLPSRSFTLDFFAYSPSQSKIVIGFDEVPAARDFDGLQLVVDNRTTNAIQAFDFADGDVMGVAQRVDFGTTTAPFSDGDTVDVSIIKRTTINTGTGDVDISGSPVSGETLTADLDSVSDNNGTDNVSTYGYQWYADGQMIVGATDRRLELIPFLAGKEITVKVYYFDDDGFQESFESAAVGPVAYDTTRYDPFSTSAADGTLHSVWSDGDTLWVGGDFTDDEFHAFNLYGDRQADDDIDQVNEQTRYLTGDYLYLWAAEQAPDSGNDRLTRALLRSDPTDADARRAIADIEHCLDPVNQVLSCVASPTAVTSDGARLWYSDSSTTVQSFSIYDDPATPVDEYGADTGSITFSFAPDALWTDGELLWALDSGGGTVEVRELDGGARRSILEIDVPAESNSVSGMWSNGVTLFVADPGDDRINTYRIRQNATEHEDGIITGAARPGSQLSVIGRIIDPQGIQVSTANFSYQWLLNGIPISGATGSTYTVKGSDLGHQISVRVNFTDKAGQAESLVARPRVIHERVALPTPNAHGLWGDTWTLWVPGGDLNAPEVRAFDRFTGQRVSSRDIDLTQVGAVFDSTAIWSDGVTIWVAEANAEELYAFNLSDGSYNSSKDISLRSNAQPTGLWGNAETIWVADNAIDPELTADQDSVDKLYAYKHADGSRQASKDFNTLDAAGNDDPGGIWSDGTTMWVVDTEDDKVYAYKMSDQSRDPSRDFLLDGEAENVRAMWAPTPNKIYVLDAHNEHAEIYKVEPTIWSATLTVGVDSSGNDPVYGWNTGGDYVGGALNDAEFSYDGEDYELIELQYSDGDLSLVFDSTKSFDGSSKALRDRLGLWVGDYRIPLSGLDDNDETLIWEDIPSYQSRAGAKVELKITVADVAHSGSILIRGTAALGEVLTTQAGVADENGLPDPEDFHYRWESGAGPIEDATAPQYYPADRDVGATLLVFALTQDDDGYEELIGSNVEGPIPADPTRSVPWSETMTAAATSDGDGYLSTYPSQTSAYGQLSNGDFTYNNASYLVRGFSWPSSSLALFLDPEFPDDFSILYGADGEVTKSDATKQDPLVGSDTVVYQWPSASDPNWSDGELVAVAMVIPINIAATGTPAISGEMTVGTSLTADTSGIADANGMDDATLTYKWERVGCTTTSDNVTLADTDDDYTVIQADLGSGCGIKLTVSFTDDDGFSESLSITRTTRVSIIGIEITSTAGLNLLYDIGDRIEVTLTYNEAMVVSGVPQLSIQLGNKPVQANYVSSASTSTALVFRYQVVEDDEDTDGISINANSLTLNGGSIVASTDSTVADLSHPGLDDDSDHKVDGVRPTIMTAVVEGDTVTLTASENLARSYNNDAFHGGFSVAFSGRSNPSVDQINMVNGTPTITLTLSAAARYNETVSLSYSRPSLPRQPIIDLAGNELNNFSNQSVTNNTPQTKPDPPTNLQAEPGNQKASLTWDAPEYNGGSPITKYQYRSCDFDGSDCDAWEDIPNSGSSGANESSFVVEGLVNGVDSRLLLRAVNAIGNSEFIFRNVTPMEGPGLLTPLEQFVDEGQTVVVPISLTFAPTASVTVSMEVGRPLRFGTEDDDQGRTKTLTFTAQNWNTPQTYFIYAPHDDNIVDEEIPISYTLTSADAGYHGLEVSDTVIAVEDDDSAVSIAANQQSVAEGESASFTLTRTGETSHAVTVLMQFTDPGRFVTEYLPHNTISVSLAANETTKSFTLNTVDDTVDEPTGTIIVRIDPDADYLVGTPSSASTQVLDDDGPPGPPGNLTAHAGDGFVRLTWTEAPSASSDVTHYSYRYRQRNQNWDPDWTQIPDSSKNTRSFTVSGLENAVDYIFQIRAANITGEGDHVGVTTAPFSTPGRPVLALLSRGNSIIASWSVPDDGGLAPDRYQLTWSTDGRWESVLGDIQVTDATQLSHVISGVEEYTTYYVRVRASNDGGQSWSPWDISSIRNTPLPRMDNITTSNPMPDRLTVNWWLIRDWDDDAGAPIWADVYEIQYVALEDENDITPAWSNAQTRRVNRGDWGEGEDGNAYADIGGLTCEKEYYVRMRAFIDSPRLAHLGHWTRWSDTWPRTSYIRDRTNQARVIEPWKTGACAGEKNPTNLQVSFNGPIATLSWVAATSQGVSGYKIERGIFAPIGEPGAFENTREIHRTTSRTDATYVDDTLCSGNRAGQEISAFYIVTSLGVSGGPFGVHTSFLDHSCPSN